MKLQKAHKRRITTTSQTTFPHTTSVASVQLIKEQNLFRGLY
jgi:hypothetical protein